MDNRALLPPFPVGWYAVALSDELKPGEVKPFKFMGEEVVLYRTRAGVANLIGAYCSHLGAHFGYGGQVVGEHIRCPFHAFEFDVNGVGQSTAYGTRLPPKAKAQIFPARERHGLILAYYDPNGKAPDWEIPCLDVAGWSPLLRQRWDFRGHPQETTENSVDIGHFTIIHDYSNVSIVKDLLIDGPYLSARYAMTRQKAVMGKPADSEFEIHVYGLGYSQVNIFVPAFGLQTRLFVLATPVDGENITLRIVVSGNGASFRPVKIHPLLGLLPRTLILHAAIQGAFDGICHDVSQDFMIWQHKRYVQPPILAEGDGPVGKYRQWAKQFYRGADIELI
jgi:nitrite reductase/ring-hydroxylating ferredoxin subunit